MEGLNFHAKRGSNKAAADGRTQDHEGRGGRLDEQPAKRSLGLLPSGPDPVGEGRACRQPPSPLYRRSRPSRQPLFQTVLSPCRLALGHERDRQAVELAVEGKGRLVVFVVHAGSCVDPTSKVSLASSANWIVCGNAPFPASTPSTVMVPVPLLPRPGPS